MVEPIHNDKTVAAAGLAASFSKAFVETFDCEIGLVPCAVGGTSLADWAVGGDLYNAALAKARAAQTNSEICAILWHQGESDMGNANYALQFKAIIDSLIEDLGLDADKIVIITGEIGEFRGASGENLNNRLTTISEYYENYGVADASGLTAEADGKHFDAPSLRVFGYRYFDIFYNCVTGKNYEFDEDPDSYRITPESTNDGYLSKVDFEEQTVGTEYSGGGNINSYVSYNAKNGVFSIAGDESNKYLALTHIGDTNQPYIDIPLSKDINGGVIVVEGSFMLSENSLSNGELIKLIDSTNTGSKFLRLIYLKEGGELCNMTGSTVGDSLGVSLSSTEFTKIKIVLNIDKNTKDIYVNGRLVGDGLALHTDSAADYTFTKARIMQYKASNAGTVYFDDYAVYETEDYLLNADFDGLVAGTVYSGTNSESLGNGVTGYLRGSEIQVVADAEGGNYVGLKSAEAYSTSAYLDAAISVTAGTKIVIEGRFLINEGFAGGGDLLKLVLSSGSITLIHVDADGELYNVVYNGNSASRGEALGVKLYYEEWTPIKVICDLENNTKEIYVNGYKIEGSFTLNESGTKEVVPTKIRIMQFKKNGGGTLYLDDLKCYYM